MNTQHLNDFGSRGRQRLQLSICALLLWLPLPLGSNRLWSNGLLILLIGFIGLGWSSFHWRKYRKFSQALRKGLPLLLCLLFIQAWVAMQWLMAWSLNPSETLLYLLLGLSYTLLFAMVLDLFNTRPAISRLVTTLIISGAIQAFYGASMSLSGLELGFLAEKESFHGIATGTFVNRNHLAGYLEMTLACGIGLLLALRDGSAVTWRSLLALLAGPKARIRLALVIMVIGLVMTHSRMGNTAFFSSLLLVGGIFALYSKKHRLRYGLILASLIVIDVLVVSQYFGLDKLQQRLMSTQLEDRIEDGQVIAKENIVRDDVYIYATSLLREHAIRGSGAGSFEAIFPAHAGPDIHSHFDHAHNDYLQFAVEYGAPGLATFTLFILLAFYHNLRALSRTESWYRSGIGFAGSMGMLALMIHSTTDFNLQIPANATCYVIITALGLLARFHERKPKITRHK